MQTHDADAEHILRAVWLMLSLALLASVSGVLIHWFSPVHRWMDMTVPPAASVVFAALMLILWRRPGRVIDVARTALLVGALALVAPAWYYTLESVMVPGVHLVTVLPPVATLFVALLVMTMVFLPGARTWLLVLIGWSLIALPVLVYLAFHPQELFTPRGRDLAMAYGPVSLLVVVLLPVRYSVAQTLRKLASERARMEVMLHHDALTGIHNRRQGQRMLESVIGLNAPAGVIMFDLDRFKEVNDTHGHPVGDLVLQTVAARCGGLLREDESLSRWGGEEFLVVLPGVDAQGLALVAERLQMAIAQRPIGPVSRVTGSFGATMIGSGDSLEDVLQRADRALYGAKADGGNRVVLARSDRRGSRPAAAE